MGRLCIATVVLCVPVLMRILTASHLGAELGWADVRGLAADMSAGLLVVAALFALLRTTSAFARVLAAVLGAVWALAHVGLYEFIGTHQSVYALEHAGYLLDPTFLLGSAVRVRHPLIALISVAVVAIGVKISSPLGRKEVFSLAAGGIALGGATFFAPMQTDAAEWRQVNGIAANLLATTGAGSELSDGMGSDVARTAFSLDLDAPRRFGPLAGKPNVLWIMLEGASAAYLPSVVGGTGVASATVSMPGLDQIASEGLLFPYVVSHQRQTNRGEYALLCGDYPRLRTAESKMTRTVRTGPRRCLPRVLSEHGYHTAYIQAAPLGFMMKDQFMSLIGFQDVIGDEMFPRSYARNPWGVDDKAFFEQAVSHVVALHENDQPFFATLLTAGSHHPYAIPSDYVPAGVDGRPARAFRWADEGVVAFVRALRRAGVLKDTVVLVTSDESAGFVARDPATSLLSQQWSFAAVLGPGIEPGRVLDVYEHVDLTASFLDLLGLDAEGFVGRSLFRRYETPDVAFFSNVYAKRSGLLRPDGTLVVCGEDALECGAVKVPGKDWWRPGSPAAPSEDDRLAVLGAIHRSDLAAGPRASGQEISLFHGDPVQLRPNQPPVLVFGGQYIDFGPKTELRTVLDVVCTEGRAAFKHFAFAKGHRLVRREESTLETGQRYRVEWKSTHPEGTRQFVYEMHARALDGKPATLTIEPTTLQIRRSSGEERAVEVLSETPGAD